jgi:VanZ family protein
MKLTKILIKYWTALLWAVVILILSCLPGKTASKFPLFGIHNMDKVLHAMFYFFFSLLLIRCYELDKGKTRLFNRLMLVIIPVLYGGLMEIVQGVFTTSRKADIIDFASDAAGALLALILFRSIAVFLSIFDKNNKVISQNH